MKKRLLLMFAVLAMAINASAYDFEVDGMYYNTISLQDLTCAVTYKKWRNPVYSGDIVIPSTVTYNGRTFSVISIGEEAFYASEDLTSVTIPASITSIEGFAFEYCSSLESVYISDLAAWCNISYGEYATPLRNAQNLYLNNVLITELVIPNSVTKIGDWSFTGWSGLTSMVIPNSVTSIGGDAFSDCKNLTSVTIPNSVTSLGGRAFGWCYNMTSVEIPNSVTSIGMNAFCEVTVTDYSCDNEKYIDYFKRTVKNQTLGENVKKIDKKFGDKLEKLTIKNNTPPTFSISDPFTNGHYINLKVYVPEDAVDIYKTADVWKDFWNINTIESGEGSGDEPETKKCANPTIEIVDGRLVATSATEGAKCYISITSDDITKVDGESIALTGVYNISSYAHAEGYENSETVTTTLVWVNPTLEGSTNIISMEAKKAVLIYTQGDNIIVSGTEQGEGIQLYSMEGRLLCALTAEEGQTIIPCNAGKGEVVIVKYGNKAVKVLM